MDAALPKIRSIWKGEGDLESKVGPRPQGQGPRLLLGGSVEAAFDRVAEHAEGWIMPGGSPDQFGEAYEAVQAAWERKGAMASRGWWV